MKINGFLLTGSVALGLICAGLHTAMAADKGATKLTPAKPAIKTLLAEEFVPHKKDYPTMGEVERLDPALDKLIPASAKIEKLAGGFKWSEGPVWDKKSKSLLFSDIPRNVIFQWREGVGTRDYLFPSGYTGTEKRGGEVGSNGLTIDSHGRLVLCAHGDRRVARLEKDGRQTTLAEFYLFRRFNSPNDLVYSSKGELYFTDPSYGLEGGEKAPRRELVFNGVYLLRKNGDVVLLTRELTFPNGVALSPDEKSLYIAVSDPARPVILAYQVKEDGTIDNPRVFFDASPLVPNRKGLPDGLKVDKSGNVFATGPGGVLVITSEGRHIGTINPGETTANCAWGDDGSTLYMTADSYLCRIKTATKGKGF